MKRLILILLAALPAWAQCSGYANSIPAQFEQVTANLSGKTFAVFLTSPLIKTVANGGLSQSTGFDICFSDPFNAVAFPVQLIAYSATAGTWWGHVKPPSLGLAPTIVRLWVGKASVSDPSSTGVWSADVLQAYPLQETGTPNATTAGVYKDATSGGHNNCSSSGTVCSGSLTTKAPTQTTGAIAGAKAQVFASGSSQIIRFNNQLTTGSVGTLSAWVLAGANTGARMPIVNNIDNTASFLGCSLEVHITDFHGFWSCANVTPNPITPGSATLIDGNWHLLALVLTASPAVVTAYLDGVNIGVTTAGTFSGFTTGNLDVGAINENSFSAFSNHTIQEVRVSNLARTAADLLAEYDSMHSPTTFFKLTNQVWGLPQ